MQFPERHNNHTLEQKSETFFRQHLPQDWNITKPERDYGQDLNIEICEEGQYRGLDLIVQLKSSETANILHDDERQQLKVSTYNYLWNNLRVVLLVKYVENENEAYWILLKDIKSPATQEQEEFTVYLPRINKLSTVDWDEITSYVREVTDDKLAVRNLSEKFAKLKEEVAELKRERNKNNYTLLFTNDDWKGGKTDVYLTISSKEHGRGNNPQSQVFQRETNFYKEVGVVFEHDEDGNAIIRSSCRFVGKIVLT